MILSDPQAQQAFIDSLCYTDQGLIPAIVQEASSKQVLMMAWMNRESLRLTFECGEAVFWSRSRREIWHKGATSGNVQRVRELRVDCDADTLLLLVDAAGPACHTGATSCFYDTDAEFVHTRIRIHPITGQDDPHE